jgi:hypothetical protein
MTFHSNTRIYIANPTKKLEGVNSGVTSDKWGNPDEKLLNGITSVSNVKVRGKNRNSLFQLTLASRSLPVLGGVNLLIYTGNERLCNPLKMADECWRKFLP